MGTALKFTKTKKKNRGCVFTSSIKQMKSRVIGFHFTFSNETTVQMKGEARA